MNLPLMGQIKEFPFPAALFTAVIVPVWLLPFLLCLRRVPDDLRIRADQKIIPPALQLFPYGTIYDLLIFPVICNPHDFYLILSFGNCLFKIPKQAENYTYHLINE